MVTAPVLVSAVPAPGKLPLGPKVGMRGVPAHLSQTTETWGGGRRHSGSVWRGSADTKILAVKSGRKDHVWCHGSIWFFNP